MQSPMWGKGSWTNNADFEYIFSLFAFVDFYVLKEKFPVSLTMFFLALFFDIRSAK